MGTTGTSPASRGRLLALRSFGWLLGVFTIGPSLYFIAISIVSDDPVERSHRFHNVGGFAGIGLIGVFTIIFVLRPDWIAVFHVLVMQTFAWIVGGLMGGDVISGLWITALVGLVILVWLHPDPRSLRRLPGRTSIALLTFGLLVSIPAWIYAVEMAEKQHGPTSDPHVELHHWSGVAVAALAIAGAAIGVSLRGRGWRVAAAITSGAAVLFGLAGLAFSDLPGAPPGDWSWIAIAIGIGFWLLVRVEVAREASLA